jgi:hypothetical protein
MGVNAMNTPDEVLNTAADLLERDGWTQKRMYDDGTRCMVGAMLCAATGIESYVRMSDFTEDQLNVYQEGRQTVVELLGSFMLTGWNDTPGRTQEEVVQVLRDAAVKWRMK